MKCNEFIYVVLYLNPTCVSPISCICKQRQQQTFPSSQRAYKMQRELQKLNMKEEKKWEYVADKRHKKVIWKRAELYKSMTTNGRAATTPCSVLFPAMVALLVLGFGV